MREIKFRAWDKKNKVYYQECDWLSFNPTGIRFMWTDYAHDETMVIQLTKGTYELVQYTGLKDKNGKEIYEGDVVELRQETPKGSESLLITTVKWSESGLNYNVYPCHDDKYWKVIGNIYENPELLKVNNEISN